MTQFGALFVYIVTTPNVIIISQNDVYEEYGYEYEQDYMYEEDEGGYDFGDAVDERFDDAVLSLNNDYDWDEITNSYAFGHANEANYGRFGSHRSKIGGDVSSAVMNVMNSINLKALRPKLLYRTLPFLYPSITKCVHTKVAKLCLTMDLHQKTVKLGTNSLV